jgi:hypothetical protein
MCCLQATALPQPAYHRHDERTYRTGTELEIIFGLPNPPPEESLTSLHFTVRYRFGLFLACAHSKAKMGKGGCLRWEYQGWTRRGREH